MSHHNWDAERINKVRSKKVTSLNLQPGDGKSSQFLSWFPSKVQKPHIRPLGNPKLALLVSVLMVVFVGVFFSTPLCDRSASVAIPTKNLRA